MRRAALPLLLAALLSPALAQAGALSVCTEASPEGFDVVQYNALTTTNASADVLMNRLVEFDATSGKVVPSLAESWTVSADGLVYDFRLRPGVKFHSTPYFKPSRVLNADDVLFSFQRMLYPAHSWHKITQSGYPHAQSLQLPSLIKQVEAPDPLSVRFTLDHPDATFLATLSMGFASIYPAEYADQLLKAGTPEKLNSQPVGTGPFVFNRFQKDAVVRYRANPDYFNGKPAVDPLIFAITPDANAYLDSVLAIFFAFGASFELPVAMVILVLLGWVTPQQFKEGRGYAIVGIFVVAAVLTPPDVVSQLMLAIPMCLLYELGIHAARWLVPSSVVKKPAA